MKSKVTGGATIPLFTARILNKYDIKYYQCEDTGFIQTEEPFWIEEAYTKAITKLDIGLVHRNQIISERISKILLKQFNPKAKFLDFAGGYGMLTRMMRDRGFDFYHTDKYCTNLFAEYFDLIDVPGGTGFEAVTAFEVIEHMIDPVRDLTEILKFSDNLLFSTELQPQTTLQSINDWWYFIPETGQHISLFTERALEYIAQTLGYNFYTDGKSLHLFTKRKFQTNPLQPIRPPFIIRKMMKLIKNYETKKYPFQEGLLEEDWKYIKSLISRQGN